MPTVVSLFLPRWPTDRLRRGLGAAAPAPDTPLVLIGREGRRRIVLSADRAAHASGLRAGMPVTKAQALVIGLVMMDADPRADAVALDALAVWALRYSPLVAADPPDGLVIDTTGTDHLHDGEDAMLSGMVERFAASGVTARAAVAESWGAAHALARHGGAQRVVVAAGSSHEVLRDLPVAALRLPAEMVASLRVLGFERIGDLASTPRAPLTLRFGPELGRRVDQALGQERDLVARIAGAIRDDGLRAGDRLNESRLAERLNVSRTPVRAALRRLADLGYVAREPNRGVTLARLPPVPQREASDEGDDLLAAIARDRGLGCLGEQVSETELMRLYGRGRQTIRGALQRLCDLGSVERRPGYGWSFVNTLRDAQERQESYRFRIVVEVAAILAPGFALLPGWADEMRARHERALTDAWGSIPASPSTR